MGLERYISTQTSILIAGALVAGGLFFGLRGRTLEPAPVAPAPAAPPAPSAASAPSVMLAPVAAEAAGSVPTLQPSSLLAPTAAASAKSLDAGAVGKLALAALDKHRKRIGDACVTPALAKKPQPPTIKLTFNFTFDGTGTQLGRGVSEDRATGRAEVTACILKELPALSIAAPGQALQVDVEWILP